jgi:phosphoribosylaminoimidazole (AIR) synthetase
MIAAVSPADVLNVTASLTEQGERVVQLGHLVKRISEGVVYKGKLAL